jgi:hypothetical protein
MGVTGSQEEGTHEGLANGTSEHLGNGLTAAGSAAPATTEFEPATTPLEPATTPLDAPAAQPDPPTSQLLIGSVGDRCANCGAPLASDQRYCVRCGERRGAGRFSTNAMAAPAPTASKPSAPPAEHRRSWPAGATLIAGIATLLLAMGVGVLIGKAGNSNNSSAAKAPEVITVNGGAAATGSGSTGSTVGAASSSGTTHHAAAKTTHTAPAPKTEAGKAKAAAAQSKPTQAAVSKASHAASSVLGGSNGQSQNTVTSGQSCASGSAGCQGGHFTGNFFGQ